MDFLTFAIVVGLGFPLLLVVIGVVLYNQLVSLKNRVDNAWHQIDVQLKRRHDLIPNLVETVKGYASHEQQTLTQVTEARASAVQAQGVAKQAEAENMLSQALGKLMAVSEQYPDLKANENFLALQEELTSTENKVGFARQHYNDSVMRFNTKQELFPANIVAGMFGFSTREYFEIEATEQREAPAVSF